MSKVLLCVSWDNDADVELNVNEGLSFCSISPHFCEIDQLD